MTSEIKNPATRTLQRGKNAILMKKNSCFLFILLLSGSLRIPSADGSGRR
jgi:hypothetical protein